MPLFVKMDTKDKTCTPKIRDCSNISVSCSVELKIHANKASKYTQVHFQLQHNAYILPLLHVSAAACRHFREL
jgi:hypothetical protein